MKKTVAFLLSCLTVFCVISFDVKALAEESEEILSSIQETISSENLFQNEQIGEATEIEYADTADEFLQMSVEMVEENYEDSYFSSIVVDIENNTIKKDGEEEIISEVPVVSVVSEDTTDENNEISLYSVLEAHSAEGEFEQIIENAENVNEKVADVSEAQEKSQKYITLQEFKKQGYELIKGEGGSLIITRPFQTKRLIVRTKGSAVLENVYDAVSAISDGEGRYVLQFETIESTMNAYACYSSDKTIDSVSADKVTVTSSLKGSILEEYGFDRWGANRTETDRFASYLTENNQTTKVVVAVVDTGIANSHELLYGRIESGGYDFVNNDSTPYDDNSHGTHVAGIIADNTPSTVKILPIKCFSDMGESTDLIISLGIEKAIEKNVDVINMSFGGVCGEDDCEVSKAVKKAIKAGIVCVAAAGNESSSADYCCPANIESCITVSSVNEQDEFSSFSNFGKCIDIAAPGENILSSIPDVMGSYAYYSGTSMAAPFVSAAVAMLLTNTPSLTVSKVETALKKAVVDLGIKGDDLYFGAGVLDFGVYLGDKKSAETITLSANTATVYSGKYVELSATPIDVEVKPFDATDKSYSVTFSKSSIAEYDGLGLLGISAGTTTAKFSLSNGAYASCAVTCKKSELWIDYASSSYSSGKGTQSEPYLISSASQLAKIAADSYNYNIENNTYFKLTKNIDLANKIWYPILGMDKNGYTLRINLDGNGYSISNMTIKGYNTGILLSGAGLFYNAAGEVKNLNLLNVYINLPNTELVGAVASSFGGYLKNCYVTGSVRGLIAGGLVGDFSQVGGSAYSMGISNCRSDVTVKGANVSGGIVGTMLAGVVNNCIFNGKIASDYSDTVSGGICGILSSSNALNDFGGSYAENTLVASCVSITNIAGGRLSLDLSSSYSPTIKKCYYSGNYTDGVDVDFYNGNKETQKVTKSNITNESFYTNSSNWADGYLWDVTSLWKVSSAIPVFKTQKDKAKTSVFDYVDLGSEIIVNGYSGTDTTVKIPKKIDGKPVRYIDSLFTAKNAKVKTIVLSDNVRVIAPNAFCADDLPYLTKVTLGNDVRMIGSYAFDGVGISYITFPASLKIICANAFSECENLKYAVFTSKVGDYFSKNAFLFANSKGSVTVCYPSGYVSWTLMRFNSVSHKRYTASKACTIYAPDITTLKVGKTTSLAAVLLPQTSSATITYSSSDTSIATVSSSGKITPKKKGTVKITFKSSDGNVKVTKEYKITAYAPYTVTFDGNGATSGSTYTQSLPYATATNLTANKFKKTGYTFIGWSTSKTGEVKYTDGQSVKKVASAGGKKTLYAVWKANTYTVKFNANGGSGTMSAQKGFTYGVKKSLKKNTFTAPKGKVFAGWSKTKNGTATITNAQKVSKLTSKNAATVTLYAVWVTPKTYKITYTLNGGKMPSSYKKTYKSGTGCTLPVPTRSGYNFAGWYTKSDFSADKVSSIKPWQMGNIKLYAKWTKK